METNWYVDPTQPGIVRSQDDPHFGILAGIRAPLVAAAPDLLEAAKGVEAAFRLAEKSTPKNLRRSIVYMLLDAIAKAEGR